jgi:hypothetical protein
MALTKLTKHIVYGATIVQCRYKDMSNLSTANTGATNWDSITITPEYADSILEVRFSGVVSNNSDSSSGNQGTYDSPRCNLFMLVNGQTEYTINDAASVASFDNSYNSSAGRREGATVNMYHRHLPGTTNLQTVLIQVSRSNNNGGGNMNGQNGFLMVKEIAGGLTVGTPSNNFVN